jgi:hypothetical protein
LRDKKEEINLRRTVRSYESTKGEKVGQNTLFANELEDPMKSPRSPRRTGMTSKSPRMEEQDPKKISPRSGRRAGISPRMEEQDPKKISPR